MLLSCWYREQCYRDQLFRTVTSSSHFVRSGGSGASSSSHVECPVAPEQIRAAISSAQCRCRCRRRRTWSGGGRSRGRTSMWSGDLGGPPAKGSCWVRIVSIPALRFSGQGGGIQGTRFNLRNSLRDPPRESQHNRVSLRAERRRRHGRRQLSTLEQSRRLALHASMPRGSPLVTASVRRAPRKGTVR